MPRVRLENDDFRRFQRSIRRVDRELSKELNKELKTVVKRTIIPAAQRNAGWSTRIPGAIKPQVGVRTIGVRVAGRQAPHARPLEGAGGQAWFRHPVFGNREVWVNQRTRPFLGPAVDRHADDAVKAAGEAVENAARKIGFR